jgi:hypothetical protein
MRLPILLLCAAAGCFSTRDEDLDTCPVPEPETVVAGASFEYVVDSFHFPSSYKESQDLGVDLDRHGDPDNQIGAILALFADRYDLDGATRSLIESGAIVHVVELRARSLADATGVGVTTTNGHAGGIGHLAGRIAGGRLHAELGTLPLAVTLPGLGRTFVLPLVGVTLDAEVSAEHMQGTIAGAIRAEDTDLLVQAIHEGFTRIVSDACQPICPERSFAELLLEVFDADHDGVIGLDELRTDPVTVALLAPDVDLYDGDTLGPGCDPTAEDDALSVAIGFTATGRQ